MTGDAGKKVLTICSNRQTDVGDLVPVARGVAREVRRLHFEGYDLRSFEVKAFVVRDDRLLEVRRKNS